MSLITTIMLRSLLPLVNGSEIVCEYDTLQNAKKLTDNISLLNIPKVLIDNCFVTSSSAYMNANGTIGRKYFRLELKIGRNFADQPILHDRFSDIIIATGFSGHLFITTHGKSGNRNDG